MVNAHPPLGINLGMFNRALLGGVGIPSWVVNPANPPDLAFDFTNDRAWNKATKVTSTSKSLLTVSRASSGTVNDSLGNWTSVASNLPRISDLGLLVEEARTNSIRNNSMVGAVVMADGVELLTNGNFAAQGSGWTVGQSGAGSVVFSTGQAQIIGDGTNGNYISQRITGLIVGRSYVIAIAALANGGFNASVGSSAGSTSILGLTTLQSSSTVGASNPDRIAFTATATSAWVTISRPTASAQVLTSVSVQDGERVQNGGFAFNPINAAVSTIQNGWQWANSSGTGTAVWNSGSNSVTLTSDATHSIGMVAAIPTVAGFTYTLSVDITSGTGQVFVGSTNFGNQLLNMTGQSGAGKKYQFTATGSTSFLDLNVATGGGNATFANVSVQSAGALPTNWSHGGGTAAGLRWNVVAVGNTNGVNTVDIEYVGTSTSTGWNLNTEASAIITSSYGQTWAVSGFDALAAGSLTNVGAVALIATDTGGSQGTAVSSGNFTPTSTFTRRTSSGTLTSSGNTSLRPSYVFTVSNASAIDFTLRIGWPQLENNSLINSTVASAVVAAGGTGYTVNDILTLVGGSGTAGSLKVTTVSAGVITAVSVNAAGSYTTLPPSPVSITGGTGTGATFTLTPTNNAASAFVTSPIATSGSAATRAADVVTMTSPPAFGSAYSMFAQATPQAPTTYPLVQDLLSLSDGTTSNRVNIRRGATGTPALLIVNGGSVILNQGVGGAIPWNINSSSKFVFALAPSDERAAVNGTLDTNAWAFAGIPSTLNAVNIGAGVGGSQFFNGFVSQAAIWATQRVPNAQLQSMTT